MSLSSTGPSADANSCVWIRVMSFKYASIYASKMYKHVQPYRQILPGLDEQSIESTPRTLWQTTQTRDTSTVDIVVSVDVDLLLWLELGLDWHGLSNPSDCRGLTRKRVDVTWMWMWMDPSYEFVCARRRRRWLRPLARPTGALQRVAGRDRRSEASSRPVSARRPPNFQGRERSISQWDFWNIWMWHDVTDGIN